MSANGPVRVLGGAGTGKTVALMHRANYLASQVFIKDSDRIMVTTFTRNLALDLKMNLRNLCAPESFSRIEVTNLHSWCVQFMRKQRQEFLPIHDHERREFFELAMTEAPNDSFDTEFYMDEWEQVVQAQDVLSRDDYLTARRVGRRTRLSRRQRAMYGSCSPATVHCLQLKARLNGPTSFARLGYSSRKEHTVAVSRGAQR